MTLDPVHLDGIASLARRIRHDVDEADHREVALDVWEHYLDPLYGDDAPLLEPVDELRRYAAPVEDVGLQEPAFEAVHGLDSGTVNPQTFKNGLVLDVAQAAMSATPSDLDLHRARTIVASVHSNDATVDMAGEWTAFDEGYVKGRLVHVPRLARDQERVVHGLSLYLAESEHALSQADAVEDCLLLDGPVYPKEMLNWADRHAGIEDVVTENELVREVFENYTELVERFADRGVPLAGFVKSARSQALVDALRERETPPPTPWASDLALFRQVLERHERVDGERVRREDELTWTNWFVSRLGADGAFAAGESLPGVERTLPASAYEVAFFVVYDPRADLAFRVELPRAFADDEETRARVRRQVLRDVAAEQGPPEPVRKADALARIGREEKASLVSKVGAALDSEPDHTYDDRRWGAFGQ